MACHTFVLSDELVISNNVKKLFYDYDINSYHGIFCIYCPTLFQAS